MASNTIGRVCTCPIRLEDVFIFFIWYKSDTSSYFLSEIKVDLQVERKTRIQSFDRHSHSSIIEMDIIAAIGSTYSAVVISEIGIR